MKKMSKSSARIKHKRRSAEPWTSTNRILNSNSGHKKPNTVGRNPNFDTDETQLLIQLWGDPKVQRTLITTHKKHAVICQLATKMQEYGYYRSPAEITTRIKNLKCFYNRLKKDVEAGLVSGIEPSWKHYVEMDAIMTRPIFSVRPNEVPAPSLKYSLEKAREEREERKRQILAEGGTGYESEDELDEIVMALNKINGSTKIEDDLDDGIIPDVEVDIDIGDETFVAIAQAAESSTRAPKKRKFSTDSLDDVSDYEGALEINEDPMTYDCKDFLIKEENDAINSISDNVPTKNEIEIKPSTSSQGMITSTSTNYNDNETVSTSESVSVIPKDEPIDVDAEDELHEVTPAANVQALMPTLADILMMSSKKSANSSPATKLSVSTVTTSSMANVSSTTTSMQAAPSKISLVPTNFLMQPKPPANMAGQAQQIHLLKNALNPQGQLQPRLLLSGPQPTAANTQGIVTTGPGGMKVLLVNAEQAGNSMCATAGLAQQINAANCLGKTLGAMMPLNNTALLQQQQQQIQQQQQQIHQQQQQQQKDALQLQKMEDQKKRKSERDKYRRDDKDQGAAMRALLRQLVNAQTENNEIQREQLALERERLEVQKGFMERFTALIPTMCTPKQPPQSQYPQQQTVSLSTAHLRLNPQKLVFATAAMPSSVGNTATLLTTNTLTATLPKPAKPEEPPNQSNDVQLLTPKLEIEL